jgi:HlyD family secretion protein
LNPGDIRRLLAGYSADIEVILDAHRDTLRVPSQAVVENTRVYVLQAGTGLLQARSIETGMSNWDYTEILSGVAEGELVVTSVDRAGVEDGAQARRED